MISYLNLRTAAIRSLQTFFVIIIISLTAFANNISHEFEALAGNNIAASTYEKLHLANLGLKYEVLQKAIAGYQKLADKNLLNSHVISIADFSQSSKAKRLYVIDLAKGELLFQTWVAHGRNSGNEFATSFSNESKSYKSSLGLYITGTTYTGKHGLSLKLHGMEKGINDNAENRAIVIHGAPYVSEAFIRQTGRLGRSEGCPAVSEQLSDEIINAIKGGSCYFIYH